ncbi:hypothetical protein QBC47DRAFT_116628 [Echria macrotheca]|uniref:Protein kinase domain-containing protein n=1 Tax=Echria macrotheca TaxID=438768 RepID=A0AAJ0BKW8_9PEZI|nr:hypothetical protein QBC47DRAFT_116628 [Echria macrotheca]
MPTLFREVDLPTSDDESLRASIVYYEDGEDGPAWVTWTSSGDQNASPFEFRGRIFDTFESRLDLALAVQEFLPFGACGCETHRPGVVHLRAHRDERERPRFVCYGWRPVAAMGADGPDLAIIIPAPPMLELMERLASEFERGGINLLECNKATVRAIPKVLNQKSPSSEETVILGFARRLLHVTPICLSVWHVLENMSQKTQGFIEEVGSATFQQVVDGTEIPVFNYLEGMISAEAKHSSGASFDVTIAKAREHSSLPPYKGGKGPTKRRQWKRNALLVLKRPKLSGAFDPSNSLNQLRGDDASERSRISRTVVNELLILSHHTLRNHPNIVHLFGIAWDRDTSASVTAPRICPILVQSCADLGNLDQYLLAMKSNGKLTWSLRCDILKQILSGLRALHDCGVVHGDIKTLNILVAATKAGPSKPRIMLADFGYSVIVYEGQSTIQVVGTTLPYASPEMFRCLRSNEHTISSDEAYASDIYSFGLAACSVTFGLFGGQDIFSKIGDPAAICATYGVDFSVDPVTTLRQSQSGFWEETKVDQEAHELLITFIMFIIELEAGSCGLNVIQGRVFAYIIKSTLMWSPDARPRDLGETIEALELFLGEDSQSSGASELPWEEETGVVKVSSKKYYQKWLQFMIVDGWVHSVPISDIELCLHFEEFANEPFASKERIFSDFMSKASLLIDTSPSEWKTIRLRVGIKQWAEAAHAAFQLFYCYISGFGTERDLVGAARYIAASAEAGFVNAYSLVFEFHKLHPELELPLWTRNLDGLFHFVSIGPRIGFAKYLEELRLLRTLDPVLAQKALDVVNAFAYSEIGEEHVGEKSHEEETFKGPDVQYQWFEPGSMGFFQRLAPLCTAEELIRGFGIGIFPADDTNYNRETALYMCCRLGAADSVLALAEEFDWFRKQAGVATLDNRFPLHQLHNFAAEWVAKVGVLLLENGADVSAADASGFRAVDYAILSGRNDVATFLLDQQPPLFTSPELRSADMTTAREALLAGPVDILERCLQHADVEAILASIEAMACHLGMLATRDTTAVFRVLVSHLPPTTSNHLAPDYGQHVSRALGKSVVAGNLVAFNEIFDRLLPESGLPVEQVKQLLMVAAFNFRVPEFRRILTIPTQWEVGVAHDTLQAIALTMQGPKNHVFEVAEILIRHLEGIDLLPGTLNYIAPGTICEPDCSKRHSHTFKESLFTVWIRLGYHDVARLLAPHVDGDSGYPTTLWHLLQFPDAQVLDHIEFLMELGDHHMKYVAFPLTNLTPIQEACIKNENFSSPREFMRVLDTLIEYYIGEEGEDIDFICKDGATALMWAADYASPEAVSRLLEWQANPYLELTIRPVLSTDSILGSTRLGRFTAPGLFTPYEFVLYRLMIDHLFGAASISRDFSISSFALPASMGTSEKHDAQLTRQFNTLAALSSSGGKVADTEIASLLQEDPAVPEGITIKSLVPKTKRRWAQILEHKDGQGQYLEIWGCVMVGDFRASMQVIPVEDLPTDELITQAQYRKRRAKAGVKPILRFTHAIAGHSGSYLYQFLVESRDGGWDASRDWEGPDGVVTWDEMVTEVPEEDAADENQAQAHRADEVGESSSRVEPSRATDSTRQLLELEDDDDELLQRVQGVIRELQEADLDDEE